MVPGYFDFVRYENKLNSRDHNMWYSVLALP